MALQAMMGKATWSAIVHCRAPRPALYTNQHVNTMLSNQLSKMKHIHGKFQELVGQRVTRVKVAKLFPPWKWITKGKNCSHIFFLQQCYHALKRLVKSSLDRVLATLQRGLFLSFRFKELLGGEQPRIQSHCKPFGMQLVRLVRTAHALRSPLQTFKNLQYAWFIHTLLHIHIHNYDFTKC